MRTIIYLYSLLTLIVLCGCNKENAEILSLEIVGIEPSSTLNPEGGEIKVKYSSAKKPTVTAPDWLSFDDNYEFSGTTGVVKFTYEAATEPRKGEIILSLSSSASVSVMVTQEKLGSVETMDLTATQLAAKMYAGINIGNTMECPGQEGLWSRPVNAKYVAALADIGFNAVRIPCAWDSHVIDASTNTIDPVWLDRVDEVIGYVVENGMFAILNIHWDGGWLENTCADGFSSTVNKKQHDYWTQIANKLNHYDERVLFAAMNEPNINETGKTEEEKNSNKRVSINAIMTYQQTMLDAVRVTGGNNAKRVLVMQAPCTSNEIAVEGTYKLPHDVISDRLMIETHFYGPYQFNMMENDANWGKTLWYWGKENHIVGSDRNCEEYEEDWVREELTRMKNYYADKGVPGILGEYCVCCNRERTPGIDKEKWRASARLWAKVVTREAKNAGMVPFFWETGGDIERINGTIKNSLQIDGVLEGAAEGTYPF